MRADLPTSYRTRFPKENPGRIAMMLVVPAARSCAARPGAPSIRLEGEGRTIEAHRGAKRSLKRAARGARGAAAVCVGESIRAICVWCMLRRALRCAPWRAVLRPGAATGVQYRLKGCEMVARRALKRAARGARGATAARVGESNLRLVHVAAGVALRALTLGPSPWGGEWCMVEAHGPRSGR